MIEVVIGTAPAPAPASTPLPVVKPQSPPAAQSQSLHNANDCYGLVIVDKNGNPTPANLPIKEASVKDTGLTLGSQAPVCVPWNIDPQALVDHVVRGLTTINMMNQYPRPGMDPGMAFVGFYVAVGLSLRGVMNGPQDFNHNTAPRFDNYGNVNYGAQLAALGLSLDEVQSIAGLERDLAHIKYGWGYVNDVRNQDAIRLRYEAIANGGKLTTRKVTCPPRGPAPGAPTG